MFALGCVSPKVMDETQGAPFADLLSVMSDPQLKHTVGEYGEWRNPERDQDLEAMAAYCPYFNVREGAKYPPILATSSVNDARVPFWIVAKWVERIRTSSAAAGGHRTSPCLLLSDPEAGHFGRGGRLDPLLDASIEAAFLIKEAAS